MPLNEDGGTDKDGKQIHVKFRPKAGDVTDFNDLSDYLMKFLNGLYQPPILGMI